MKNYEVCDKTYPVEGHVKLTDENGNPMHKIMPLVDVNWTEDYEWQLRCLKSRIENPNLYQKTENTNISTFDLKNWLIARTTEELYSMFKDKYRRCYDFIFDKKTS